MKIVVENNFLGDIDQLRLMALREKRDTSFLTDSEKMEMWELDGADQQGDFLAAKYYKDPESLTALERERLQDYLARYYEQIEGMSGEKAAEQAVRALLTGNTGFRSQNYTYPYLSTQEHKDQYNDAYWDSVDGDGGWSYKWITHPFDKRQIDENEAYYNDYVSALKGEDRLAWERQVGTPVLIAMSGQYLWNAAAPAIAACTANPVLCGNQVSNWVMETIAFEGAPAAGLGMTASGLAKTLSKEQMKELTVLMVAKEKGLIDVTPKLVNQVIHGQPEKNKVVYDKISNIIVTESKAVGQAGKGTNGQIIKNSDGLHEVKINVTPLEGQGRLNTIDVMGNNKLNPAEAAAAARMETVLGKMERLTDSTTGRSADYIITTGSNKGKTVDLMYTTKNLSQKEIDGINKFFEKNMTIPPAPGKTPIGKDQINKHLGKADIVPVDFGVLTPKNQKIFTDYIKTLPKSQQDKIIIMR